jgi:uncharacterized cupredoxin-like copper-binding protein
VVRKLLVCVAVAIPLAFAACGDDEDTSTTAAGETSTEATTTEASSGGETIDISETEFALDPSDPTTAAGPVTINVSNDGETVHDLEVEGNGVEEVTPSIEAGGSAQLSVDLEPGEYKIYCTIPGHADQGMEGTLTVE